jgi:hypothetical protein
MNQAQRVMRAGSYDAAIAMMFPNSGVGIPDA